MPFDIIDRGGTGRAGHRLVMTGVNGKESNDEVYDKLVETLFPRQTRC